MTGKEELHKSVRIAVIAWMLAAIYYFYQYALRSAPAVMMPELSNAFGISPLAVASIVGLFYYGYSPFSLVAGAAMDRLGPRRLLPGAAVIVGIGALLFATGNHKLASIGQVYAGRWRRLCACRRDLYRDQKLSAVARRHFDWRHPNVWYGGRIGRTVCRWATDRQRASLECLLDGNGSWRLGDWRVLFVLLPKDERTKLPGSWFKSTATGFQNRLQEPAVDLVWPDCRLSVHPDHNLRHDLGSPLSPGGAWSGLWLGGHALSRRFRSVGSLAALCLDLFPIGSGGGNR